jgi:hypothetical protein
MQGAHALCHEQTRQLIEDPRSGDLCNSVGELPRGVNEMEPPRSVDQHCRNHGEEVEPSVLLRSIRVWDEVTSKEHQRQPDERPRRDQPHTHSSGRSPELARESGPMSNLLHGPVDRPHDRARNQTVEDDEGTLNDAATPIASVPNVAKEDSRSGDGSVNADHGNGDSPEPTQVLPTASYEDDPRSNQNEAEDHADRKKPPPADDAATYQLGGLCLQMRGRGGHAPRLDHGAARRNQGIPRSLLDCASHPSHLNAAAGKGWAKVRRRKRKSPVSRPFA